MTVSIANAKLRRHRTWLRIALVSWTLGGMLPVMFALLVGLLGHHLWLLSFPLYFGGIVGVEMLGRRWLQHLAGALRADENGLFLGGKLLVARKDITHGYVVRDGERAYLRFVARGIYRQPLDLEVADEGQANDLLAAMHLDRTVAEYTMLDSHERRAWLKTGLLLTSSLIMAGLSIGTLAALAPRLAPGGLGVLGLVSLFLFLCSLAGFNATFMTREVFIAAGADGVWIRQYLIKKRFVAFGQLANITQSGRDITLTLTDGETIELHQTYRAQQDTDNFVARIRAGIEASRAAPPRAGEAMARNGRTTAEWVAAVCGQRDDRASYRQQAMPEEQLWRIVEDAAAEPSERAGAALALRVDLSDEGKARLRVAAGACAEKKLRVALESVVTAEDEALLAALEPLEEDRVTARESRRYR